VSYTIAYAFGIVLAYLLYRFYVFGRKARAFGPMWVALIYLSQYLLGVGLVNVWVQLLRQPALWAPLFSVLISLPLTYLLSRWVFPSTKSTRTAGKRTNE
jgi:putative flippase GtrA